MTLSRQQYSEVAAARVGWRLSVALDAEIRAVWRCYRRYRHLALTQPDGVFGEHHRSLAHIYKCTLESLFAIRAAGKGL